MTATLRRTSAEVLVLAGAEFVIAVVISLTPNPEGWLGGLVYFLVYGGPLLAMAWALRSGRRWLVRAAGIGAAAFGVYCLVVPIGNWAGYAGWWEQARAVIASIPPIVASVLVFWAAILRHEPRAGIHA